MSKMDPNEQEMRRVMLEGEVAYIQGIVGNAAGRLAFTGPLEDVSRRAQVLTGLHEQLARARARGYAWAGDLEQRLTAADGGAQRALEAARQESQRAASGLRGQVDAISRESSRVMGAPVLKIAGQVESMATRCRALDGAIDAAERKVRDVAAPFVTQVDALEGQLKNIHWTLDQFESASFRMQPEENPLFAIKATWEDSPQGKREGLLMLTAHRIRFEHQEEVVLERSFLFFASKTEMRKALLLDTLVGHIAASDDSERGILIKDQMLTLTFRQPNGSMARATFEIDGRPAKEVDTIIEQIRGGDLERSRFQGAMPAQSKVGVPVRWPNQCTNCGAGLQPPVRGQTFITCEYCRHNHDVVLGEG